MLFSVASTPSQSDQVTRHHTLFEHNRGHCCTQTLPLKHTVLIHVAMIRSGVFQRLHDILLDVSKNLTAAGCAFHMHPNLQNKKRSHETMLMMLLMLVVLGKQLPPQDAVSGGLPGQRLHQPQVIPPMLSDARRLSSGQISGCPLLLRIPQHKGSRGCSRHEQLCIGIAGSRIVFQIFVQGLVEVNQKHTGVPGFQCQVGMVPCFRALVV